MEHAHVNTPASPLAHRPSALEPRPQHMRSTIPASSVHSEPLRAMSTPEIGEQVVSENPEKIVRSRHSVFSVTLSLAMVALALVLFTFETGQLVPRDDSLLLNIGGIGAGLLLAYVGLASLTSRYRIDLSGIERRDLFGHRYVHWEDAEQVFVLTDYFGGFNLIVGVRAGRGLRVMTSLIGNRVEVAKAVIEAATTANPRTVLSGWGAKAYGAPPFGIFGSKEDAG